MEEKKPVIIGGLLIENKTHSALIGREDKYFSFFYGSRNVCDKNASSCDTNVSAEQRESPRQYDLRHKAFCDSDTRRRR
jgi:hypothetical protein